MSLGLGKLLTALGTGLYGYADTMAQSRQADAQQAQRLLSDGLVLRSPKPRISGPGMMTPMDDGDGPDAEGPDDILADAVHHAPPMNSVLGMGQNPVTIATGLGRMLTGTPDRSQALQAGGEALKSDAAQTPKTHVTESDLIQAGGKTYEYHPELSDEGRRMSLQQALKEPGNRAAFQTLRSQYGDQVGDYNPSMDYAAVQQQVMSSGMRSLPDQSSNQAAYQSLPESLRAGAYNPQIDYVKRLDSHLGREDATAQRVDFRLQFPPVGSNGGKDDNGMTARQEQMRAQRVAEGVAATGAEAAAAERRQRAATNNATPVNEIGYVRNYLRQNPQVKAAVDAGYITEEEVQGIAAKAVRSRRSSSHRPSH